jgi:hypothetical protein
MEQWLQRHEEYAAAYGRARTKKVRRHIKNLNRISATRDPKAFNAAVRASEIMLAANVERFRKQRDGYGGPGMGVNILVQTGIPAPQVTAFVGQGGDVEPGAVTAIEHRPDALPAPTSRPQDVPGALPAPATQAAQDVVGDAQVVEREPVEVERQAATGDQDQGGAEWF